MHTPSVPRLALIVLAALSVAGCETELTSGDEFSQTYDSYLSGCANCHAPSAPGKTSDTEQALDFSTAETARTTLRTGVATGLTGNPSACNGVPFVVAGKPNQSLLLAVLDADARKTFDLPSHPNCDNDAITDMAVKVGGAPNSIDLDNLKTWITNGAE